MPDKNSTIRSGLLADKLIGVVDGVRRKIHRALGTRPWQVDVVTRRWSGNSRGEGRATITVLTLDPTPQVVKNATDALGPGGREGAGTAIVTGVSLRYSQAELEPDVDSRSEVAYRLTELHGQKSRTSWYVLEGSPYQRRGDKPGDGSDWYIRLRETSAMGLLDGVDS